MTTATDDAPAFATYVGPKGGRAWLVTDEGEQPVGYIQTGDGRPKRYADASEWASAVAEAGMTEQIDGAAPAPDAAPAAAPDAPPTDPAPPAEPAAPATPDAPPAEQPAPTDAPSAPADGQDPPDGGGQSTPPAEPDAPPDAPPAGEQSLFEGEPDFAALDATEETDVSTAATEPTTLFDDAGPGPSAPNEPSATPSAPAPSAPNEPSATPSEPSTAPAGEPSSSPEGKAAKPPSITTGSFVSWGSKRGRVDMVVTNGSVPGIDGEEEVKGSPSSPAARVVVYEADGSGWKPTRAKVGVNVATLKRIAPLRSNGTKSIDADLVDLMAAHEEKALDAQPGAAAVKAVFERGLDAWPGEEKTVLSGEQWGLARVEAFLGLAEGKGQPGYVHDVDLLPEANPARIDIETKANWAVAETKAEADGEDGDEETVRLDATEVKDVLAGLAVPE